LKKNLVFILQCFLCLCQIFYLLENPLFWQFYIAWVKVAKATARSTPVYVPTSNAWAAPSNANQQAYVPEKASPEPQSSAPMIESAPESSNIRQEGNIKLFREYGVRPLFPSLIYLIDALDVGYSIYVRNLPLNATPHQLEEEFKKFGSIKYDGIQVRSNKVCLRN
jgi:hypothetical protein